MKQEIEYERLLEIARKMHLWIFLHIARDYEAYQEIGLTDEENLILGYIGGFEMKVGEENDRK